MSRTSPRLVAPPPTQRTCPTHPPPFQRADQWTWTWTPCGGPPQSHHFQWQQYRCHHTSIRLRVCHSGPLWAATAPLIVSWTQLTSRQHLCIPQEIGSHDQLTRIRRQRRELHPLRIRVAPPIKRRHPHNDSPGQRRPGNKGSSPPRTRCFEAPPSPMVQAKNDVRLKTGNRSGAPLRTVPRRPVMLADN